MGVKEYLETTAVFTIEEFKQEFPTVTGYNLLVRAVKGGKALHIVRGLYASNSGRYKDISPDKYLVASKLAPDVMFSYHSALELHGVAHNISSRVQYYSTVKRQGLVFRGNRFKQYEYPGEVSPYSQTMRAQAYGEISVTTKEQTLLDCMANLGRGGGPEEVLRSLSGFPYMDISVIKEKSVYLTSSAVARIGWLLEQKQEVWRVSDDDLLYFESMLTGGAYRFVPRENPDSGWSKRWRLVLPAPLEEMKEWLL